MSMDALYISLAARKVEAEGRKLRGVAATTGIQLRKIANVPGHGRVDQMFFHDGCFDVSLQQDDFELNLITDHNTRQRPWASTSDKSLSVELDGNKLTWEAELPDVPYAENLVLALDAGDYQGCSVGGKVRAPFKVNKNNVLQVHNYDINGGDLSLVTVPANPNTAVEVALTADNISGMTPEEVSVYLQLFYDNNPDGLANWIESRKGIAPEGNKAHDDIISLLRYRYLHNL